MLRSALWIWDCCLLSHSHTRNDLVVSVCHRAGLEIFKAFLDISVGIPFPLGLTGSSLSSWLWSKNCGCLMERFNAWRVTFFKKFVCFPPQLWAFLLVIPHRIIIDRIPLSVGDQLRAKVLGAGGKGAPESQDLFSWSVKKSQVCPCGLL